MPRVSWAAFAVAAALCVTGAAVARPYTVGDLMQQETFGDQAIDPSGRWIVFERRDPYESGKRFDWYLQTPDSLTRLMKVDLRHPARAKPLLAVDPGPGETLGAFSPSGTRLAIYRLRGTRMSLGVVTIATGKVRWFGITPERPDWGRGLQWLSDQALLVIARPDGVSSLPYRQGRASAEVLPGLWAASATGSGARTVVGSGAYAGLRPRPIPRQLLRLDVVSGRRRVLTTGELTDLEVSPDRQRAAILLAGADIQPQADGPAQGATGIIDQRQRLALVDLATGEQTYPCDPWEVTQHLLSWSPDSASLLVFARAPHALWTSGQVLKVDAGTSVATVLGDGLQPVLDLRPEVAHVGWMGEVPVLLARPPAGLASGRPDWYRLDGPAPLNLTRDLPSAPRRLAALDATGLTGLVDGSVWRVSPQGAGVRLSVERAAVLGLPRQSGATARVDVAAPAGSWVATGPEGTRRLQWLDARGLAPILDLPPGSPPTLVASRTGPSALMALTDPHGVRTLRLLQPDRPALTVATINRSFADIDPPRVAPVHHAGPEGRRLTSWLFLPAQTGAKPPPLVVQVYLGGIYATPPKDAPGERGFLTHVQMLTGHGYAVLVASLPLAKDTADPMIEVGARIAAIVDAAACDPALAGAFDPARVALWGHSYGGYTVMAAIAQTHRFKAAVSIAGLSDLTAKWETLPAIYRATPDEGLHLNWSAGSVESGQGGMQAPPWADPERYVRNSPLFIADRITTPLLLAHGDQDVIPLPQSEAMFAALYRQDKDAILVTYWGEGHLITNPGNVRDFYRRAFAFLDAHLAAPLKGSDVVTPPNPEPCPASSAPTTPPSPPTGFPCPGPSR